MEQISERSGPKIRVSGIGAVRKRGKIRWSAEREVAERTQTAHNPIKDNNY